MTNVSPFYMENKMRVSGTSRSLPVEKKNEPALKPLKAIKKVIFSKRPLLEKIYKVKSNYSLFNLTLANHTNKQVKINPKRQAEFISLFSKEVAELLGEEVAKSVVLQLKESYYVSTTEHHGPITHPGKLNSTLLTSQVYKHLNQENAKNVIVLACANISFDNYSFPRGIEFNSLVNGQIKEQNLVFFPRNTRPCPVIYYPSYSQDAINIAHGKLNDLVSSKEVSTEVAEKLHKILDEVYADPRVLSQKLFSDQVAITNYNMWKKIHEGQEKASNLVYVEQERIVNALVLKYHINKDTLINKILFNTRYQNLIFKHFDKIMSAFNSETKQGTFLFWGLPKGSKYRVQLWKKGNKLTTTDGSFSVELKPAAIAKAIKNREIYPSTLLSFIILSFYYGVKLLGSFNQTTYFTDMKNAFINLLKEIKMTEEIEYVEAIPTDDLTYPRPIIALTEKDAVTKKRTPLTGLDLVLYKNEDIFDAIFRNSLSITLGEAIDRVMPDLYVSYIPEQLQKKKLSELTSEKIDEVLGIDMKIESSLSIR